MSAPTTATARGKLTRRQVLGAALDYVDRHGLAALSMHKLGDELGVKAMSLYNHVDGKSDLLAGIVDVLWAEIPQPSGTSSWQESAHTLARSLRAMIHRHPHAASLLLSAQTMPEHALRVVDGYRAALTDAGLPDERAVPFLRTLVTYALGQGLAEVAWSQCEPEADVDELARIRRVSRMLPDGASDELLRVALWFCGECHPAEEFDLGVTLMIKGLHAHLAEQAADRT